MCAQMNWYSNAQVSLAPPCVFSMWDYEGESSPEKIVYYAEHASTQEGFLSWLEDPRHAMGMQNRQGEARAAVAPTHCLT
jgi:hypothetical protein